MGFKPVIGPERLAELMEEERKDLVRTQALLAQAEARRYENGYEHIWTLRKSVGYAYHLLGVYNALSENNEEARRYFHKAAWFTARVSAGGLVTGGRLVSPFVDAVIAGDMVLAKDIAGIESKLMEPRFPGEDFWARLGYAVKASNELLFTGAISQDTMQRLKEWMSFLASKGGSTAFSEALIAIDAGDAARFDEAMGVLLTRHHRSRRGLNKDNSFDFISDGGLMLAKIAAMHGMVYQSDSPYMPMGVIQ